MTGRLTRGCSSCTSVGLVLCLVALIFVSGCGGGNTLEAPGNAGTAQELAGTNWTDAETSTTYSFLNETDVDVNKPGLAQPQAGTFEVNGGLIDLTLGLKTLSGTWDGQALVIEGKALTKN
ncbi:MAG: hypothetical protein IT364_22805 [Candidatus Hydrogenedentes bacterium]|nr:hypothetical protein [Candidatus Hydrogenedentota bacterium]